MILRAAELILSAIVLCALIACSDDAAQPTPDTGVDAPTVADGPSADLDASVDLLPPDVTSPDLPPGIVPGCNAEVALTPLELGPSYCALTRFEMPAASSAFALSLDSAGWHLANYEVGASERELRVQRYLLDLERATHGDAQALFSFTIAGSENFFAGTYLAHAASVVSVGYTLFDYSGFVVSAKGADPPQKTLAAGNYDAVYLDPNVLLINGLSVKDQQGQAVYALRDDGSVATVIANLPGGSGHVARGESTVYAGYYDYSVGINVVYAFTLAEVRRALAQEVPLELSSGDLVYEGDLVDIAVRGDDLLLIDGTISEFFGLYAMKASVGGDEVRVTDIEDVAKPGPNGAYIVVPTELSVVGDVIGMRLGVGLGSELLMITSR